MSSAGTAEELAIGAYRKGSGTNNAKPNKVDTVKIALDRQELAGPPCSIGNAQHKSAFHTFAGPSTPSMPPNDPSSATVSGRPASVPHAEADGNMPHLDGRPGHVSNAMDVPEPGSHGQSQQQQHQQQQDQLQQRQTRSQMRSSAQALDQPEQSAHGDRKQKAAHQEGQAQAASASTADVDAVGAVSASATHLQPLGDVATLDKFRSMEGEAWKVFYMASKMGIRPDVIEKAAARFKVLHQR